MPPERPSPTSADDARQKAEHAIHLMHVARDLAALAASERQQRILARYVHLHCEPANSWLGRWAKQLDASPDTRERATAARTPLKRLRRTWAREKAIRDKLAAKRQALQPKRSDDLRATLALWSSITHRGIDELCAQAAESCHALGGQNTPSALDPAITTNLRDVLAANALDPTTVFTDSTSYSLGERNLLTISDSGARGTRITQINDVFAHLELLYSLRNAVGDRNDDLGLFLRSALVVELCALIELVAGPPPDTDASRSRLRVPSLRELVVYDPERDEVDALGALEGEAFESYREWLHETRDRAAAHLDSQLPVESIKRRLLDADIEQLFGFADGVLDLLDFAAGVDVRLGLLVLGQRPISGVSPAVGGSVPASMESDANIALLDNDMIAWTAGGFAQPTQARAAGIIAGRGRHRRARWFTDPSSPEQRAA